ncbi:MAG: hypothetical protein VR68_16605 [Peptococcaceae bacterium BRH_c4a]|nr:MAG: hypothetical protein VR68_16605 [Peptococcaceae bacterium BRH_c4a]
MMNQAKIKEELYRTIESIPIERLGEVLDFIKVISRDPAELFPEELKELAKARKEVAEGKFVTLEELERDL